MLRNFIASVQLSTRAIRLGAALLTILLLASCSNSKFVLGPLYNRLDDQMRKEFNKLGKFNDSQKSEFENRLQTFHIWHRRSELPRYADLLDVIEVSISTPKPTTIEDVTQWLAVAEDFSVAARRCHPVNFSFDLMKTLADNQVDFIERRFAREQKLNQDKYRARSREERLDRRYKFVIKWAGRIGLKFTAEQKTLLKNSLAKQVSLRNQYWALSAKWNREFFNIARQQSAPDYDERMVKQLDKLWTLLESNHQRQWQANRDLWSEFTVEFANSMNTSQREWADAWLPKLANTLLSALDHAAYEYAQTAPLLLGKCVLNTPAIVLFGCQHDEGCERHNVRTVEL